MKKDITQPEFQNFNGLDMRFPQVIDSSFLAEISDCPTKAFREYCLGLKGESIHLHAGACFAKALEVIRKSYYEEGKREDDCMEAGFRTFISEWGDFEPPEFGSGSQKTFDRMWNAVEFYFSEYPLASDPIKPYVFENKKTGIEYTFSVPLPLENPDTGDQLVFGGRLDMLGYYKDTLALIDEKTASALGESWVKQWKMRGQFMGYVWALHQYDIKVHTCLIRGVGILKTKFTTIQALQTYPIHMINRWYNIQIQKLNHFIQFYKHAKINQTDEYFPMSFSGACSQYGGCHWADVCRSPRPMTWYDEYEQRFWNPLENT